MVPVLECRGLNYDKDCCIGAVLLMKLSAVLPICVRLFILAIGPLIIIRRSAVRCSTHTQKKKRKNVKYSKLISKSFGRMISTLVIIIRIYLFIFKVNQLPKRKHKKRRKS